MRPEVLMITSQGRRVDLADGDIVVSGSQRVASLLTEVLLIHFSQRVGQTPMSYLAHRRLQIAARWLRETKLTITGIFQKPGFASAASFDRAFRRVHGISPSAYRRHSRDSPEVVDFGRLRSSSG
jgi:AraC-like DNA-binding protein